MADTINQTQNTETGKAELWITIKDASDLLGEVGAVLYFPIRELLGLGKEVRLYYKRCEDLDAYGYLRLSGLEIEGRSTGITGRKMMSSTLPYTCRESGPV